MIKFSYEVPESEEKYTATRSIDMTIDSEQPVYDIIEAFSEFLKAIDHCRTMRNRLVHGHWEVLWHLDKPIRFDACQIKSGDQSIVEGNYTIESLSEELIELKKVAEDFSKLRHKYEN